MVEESSSTNREYETMAYDEGLATRLEEIITRDFVHVGGLTETRMFGGFGYLLNGNMCIGIHKDTLIVRVGVDVAPTLCERPAAKMKF